MRANEILSQALALAVSKHTGSNPSASAPVDLESCCLKSDAAGALKVEVVFAVAGTGPVPAVTIETSNDLRIWALCLSQQRSTTQGERAPASRSSSGLEPKRTV